MRIHIYKCWQCGENYLVYWINKILWCFHKCEVTSSEWLIVANKKVIKNLKKTKWWKLFQKKRNLN